jgi:hypothetical protein
VVDRGVAEPERHAAGNPEPSSGEVVIRRTSTGWKVEGAFPPLPTDTVDELWQALILADLLTDGAAPGPRPPRAPGDPDEITQLRALVRQLEHALASRVAVEQAIGVLTERWRVAPRDAFEQLRRVTRSHGMRIHDLAKLVVESSTNPNCGLPQELVPLQRGADGPPEPRQSPDGRSRTEGRTRRTKSTNPPPANPPADPSSRRPAPPADPPPAQPPGRSQSDPQSKSRSNGGRSRVQAVPAPRSSSGRHAQSPT